MTPSTVWKVTVTSGEFTAEILVRTNAGWFGEGAEAPEFQEQVS